MKKISEYLNIKEAADLLGVTPNTLRNWEKRGILKPFRHPSNKFRLYDKEVIEKFLKTIRGEN